MTTPLVDTPLNPETYKRCMDIFERLLNDKTISAASVLAPKVEDIFVLIDAGYRTGEVARNKTPSSQWHNLGKSDPHDKRYECERANLVLGNLTDDELANAVFMNYDQRPSIQAVMSGNANMPIAYVTAAKDRIRWLSRRLNELTVIADKLVKLVQKLNDMNASPEFQGIWTYLWAHGVEYKGPNYSIELAEAQEAIKPKTEKS